MEAAVVLGFMGSDGNYITAHPNKDPLYYQGQHISRLEDQTLEQQAYCSLTVFWTKVWLEYEFECFFEAFSR